MRRQQKALMKLRRGQHTIEVTPMETSRSIEKKNRLKKIETKNRFIKGIGKTDRLIQLKIDKIDETPTNVSHIQAKFAESVQAWKEQQIEPSWFKDKKKNRFNKKEIKTGSKFKREPVQ